MSQSDSALRPVLDGAGQSPPQTSDAHTSALPMLAPGMGKRIWLTVRTASSFQVVMGVLLVGAALLGVRLSLPDPDTWWHVAVGQSILATHTWPTTDSYSFTAQGVHWIAYEWLGEVAMALAAGAGGLMGLVKLQMLLSAIVTGLLYYYAYLRCGNWKGACVATGLFLPIASMIFSMRPQFFGYVFLLLTLICLERFRQGHAKSLWFLPPLFLVWVNTHGTFVFGLAAMGLYYVCGLVKFEVRGLVAEPWTGRQRVQLSFAFFLCTVALLVTPYGTELAAYPLQMATTQPLNIANIQEWQPLSFGLMLGKYFLTLMLALFVAHLCLPMKHRLEELAMLLFGVYVACVHLRFTLIFVMLVSPIVAKFIAQWMPRYDPNNDRYVLNLAIIAMVILTLPAFMPAKSEVSDMVSKDYPVAAIEYLRQHPQPSGMFNDYGYGGYLIWQLGAHHKVFIDGRADLYEYSGVFQDYLRIDRLDRETLPLLRRYNIQSCLIRSKSPLATLLAASPDWKQAYADDSSAIFVQARHQAPVGD